MKLVYIAGPYRATTRWEEEQNCRRAEEAGHEVVELGAYPVIPHANTRPYFGDAQPSDFWLEGTLELMRRCDAVVLLPGWENSQGACAESDEAISVGIPIFPSMSELKSWFKREMERP